MPKEGRATPSQRTSPVAGLPPMPTTPQRPAAIWTPTEDERLMAARTSGLNWQPIATKYFPTKTANACRKRHERLMERKNAKDWDEKKSGLLAKEYMEVRKEMWSILADRLGEKWHIIEQKCMEKGLKNLQAAHRSYQRRERGMEEGDSGIGCSDAEHELDDGNAELHQMQQQEGSSSAQRGGPSIQSMLSPAHEM